MLIKTPRKILAAPLDNNATSYHRIIQPIYELMQRGEPWASNIQFLGAQEDQLNQYDWADILFIQCLYAPDAYQFYVDQKKKGKFIVLDFDDDYINIPADSPEQTEIIDKKTGEKHSFPPEMRTIYVQMFIQLADIVIVTTKHLKQLYSMWNKNIIVIPNCVSKDMCRDVPKGKNEKVKILWSGSASHLPDLHFIKNILLKVANKFGDQIEFHFQGPIDFKTEFPELPLITYPAVPFEDYLDVIQGIDADIAIAPLRSHIFNMSKSNLKYLQMTLMGAAFLGSNFGPYIDIDHGVDGMLAITEDDWVESLSKLIENADLRKALVSSATKYVETNFMIDKQLSQWQNIFTR
jgi:glycosyltransferase involved in cell wall biosynthesis